MRHPRVYLLFSFYSRYGHRRDLHSFPTRRSSDLGVEGVDVLDQGAAPDLAQLDAAAGRALGAQDAQVLLGAQQLEGLGLVRRGQDHLGEHGPLRTRTRDRKSTRLNSSHVAISYAVFCMKK